MSPSAEQFLDQLVVWRELAFNGNEYLDDATGYDSLPEWSRRTLEEHLEDERPHLYSRRELERAETADEIWNAAERRLVAEGWFHRYLRMLWGKVRYMGSESTYRKLRMSRFLEQYGIQVGETPGLTGSA